jgi:hypothetical protein
MRWAPLVLLLCACRVPQSDACKQYVECQDALNKDAAKVKGVNVDKYRDDGDCWSLPQAAEECTDQCEVALEARSELPDAPKACRSE